MDPFSRRLRSQLRKKTPPKTTDEALAEVPALQYLTLGLARDPFVHKDLELNSKQIENVLAAIAEVDESFWQLRDIPVKTCAAKLDLLCLRLSDGLKKEFTEAQFDRFQQIVLQGRSWNGLISPESAGQLKLTTDQMTRLRTALKDAVKERELLEKEVSGKTFAAQEVARAKLRVADTDRFVKVLTTQQRDEYKNLLGKPFDFTRVTQVGSIAPELRQVAAWINTDPIRLSDLRGKVVVVHFWAFGCINCIRNLPHYQSWHDKYANKGVVIVGIHTPETDSERQVDNLASKYCRTKHRIPGCFRRCIGKLESMG